MKRYSKRYLLPALAACLLAAAPLAGPLLGGTALGDDGVDLEALTHIRQEGLDNSRVMDTLHHLTDVIGPRLTGSPALRQANEWTKETMAAWGLARARLESWGPFGRGWSLEHCSVHMIAPRNMPLWAWQKAWTPGTKGVVRGPVQRVSLASLKDAEKLKGKLTGKILMLDDPRSLDYPLDPLFRRYEREDLDGMRSYPITGPRGRRGGGNWRQRYAKRLRLRETLAKMLIEEGVLATVSCSSRDGGILSVSGGGSHDKGKDPGVPAIVVAAEHYNMICRLLDDKTSVELELDLRSRFHDEDEMAYNTLAEIPGGALADQIVMAGGHLDSWHGGTGATDNAAGCAVVMEAARILTSIGIHPRRTIRFALWSGEEQGLLGSRAYVEQHFATRASSDEKKKEEGKEQPLRLLPDYDSFSAYFNLDNGGGRVRGIYTQGNVAVVPIFEAWLAPLADLGADTVTTRNTGGTDHLSFDRVGLPGFQFIQDPLDYSSRTHHTTWDVYERVPPEDLVQASVVMAWFLYNAAMRDDPLPRGAPPENTIRAQRTAAGTATSPAREGR